jgi:AcrR family transcriptional regulator
MRLWGGPNAMNRYTTNEIPVFERKISSSLHYEMGGNYPASREVYQCMGRFRERREARRLEANIQAAEELTAMTGGDPKDRILEAASRLFAEQGLEAVSSRSVTAEAGVNIAAVNYYFGSKAALLQAMTQRFFLAVNREQLDRLEALTAGTPTPSVRALLTAYATPIFAVFDSPRGREWVQALLMVRSAMLSTANASVMEGEGGAEVTSRYYEALRRALPQLPPDELWWRFERMHGLLMASQGRRAVQDSQRERTGRNERAWLITFLAGALEAAATGEEDSNAHPQ